MALSSGFYQALSIPLVSPLPLKRNPSGAWQSHPSVSYSCLQKKSHSKKKNISLPFVEVDTTLSNEEHYVFIRYAGEKNSLVKISWILITQL